MEIEVYAGKSYEIELERRQNGEFIVLLDSADGKLLADTPCL